MKYAVSFIDVRYGTNYPLSQKLKRFLEGWEKENNKENMDMGAKKESSTEAENTR